MTYIVHCFHYITLFVTVQYHSTEEFVQTDLKMVSTFNHSLTGMLAIQNVNL
jgi:hypothetical protein